jgi:uncharacterized membrane protein YphA (DoxX/SURF4 family)
MRNKEVIIKVLAEFSRLLIGIVFIFSGFVKAVDPMGGAIKIGEYLTSFGLDKLEPLSVLLSFNLSAIEFVLGICMLLGVYRRYTAIWVLLFMSFMTPLTLYLALFDPVSDCGCFGDAIILSNWATFWKNIVLDALIIGLWLLQKRLYNSWLTSFPSWVLTITFSLITIGVGIHSLNNLPFIDFRPYKIGNDILEGMELPEGAQRDQYRTTFIYSRDGVEQEFELQDAPYNDSTWTFVEQRTELIAKGEEPPIHDFSIITTEGDDLTYDILYREGKTYLVVMYDLHKTKTKYLDNVRRVYDKAQAEGAEFLVLTASSDMIDEFKQEHNLPYQFALTDPIQLKTMVRSNPGVVILEGAKVIDKFNPNWKYCKK